MKFKRRVAIFSGQLELTPLVDVVLLLLIFFVLSSSLMFSPGLKVDLPESTASTNVRTTDLVLVITDKNEVYFRDKLISPLEDYEQLRAELRNVKLAHSDETPRLIVQADRKIPLGRAITIMDIAWEEGFNNLAIATQPKGQP
jgi:biopolymer transport protein ExbD